MSIRQSLQRLASRAPAITGAVFCGVIWLSLPSCDKPQGTPDWETSAGSTPAEPTPTATPAPAPAAPVPAKTEAAPVADSGVTAEPSTGGIRFIAYNVENWLTMDRFVNFKELKDTPKPDSEKAAVVRILVKNQPDVIGLCEIGQTSDLAEIQQSLKAAGLDLPHSHHSGGSDPTRHLGLLSKFPITSTAKPVETEYQLKGRTFAINRGVLDATIDARGKSFRFLGAHLKSKREVEEGDQEEMRVNEARLMRRHVDSILQADPQARLVVYGDFNDTYPSKTVRTLTTGSDNSGRLKPIYFKDSRGHAWTHHWSNQDIYSRIDFVTLSPALSREADFGACHIIDDPDWDKASDHRPLLTVFK